MITRTYVVDATNAAKDRDTGRQLLGLPTGTRVIVKVGDRWQPAGDLPHWIAELVISHHLDIQGSPRAVNAWAQFIGEAA